MGEGAFRVRLEDCSRRAVFQREALVVGPEGSDPVRVKTGDIQLVQSRFEKAVHVATQLGDVEVLEAAIRDGFEA